MLFQLSLQFFLQPGGAHFRRRRLVVFLADSFLLLFRDAAALRVSTRHGYQNGVYMGTRYVYTWFDARSIRLFRISGAHHAFEGTPPPGDAFHFAAAAEAAWSQHVLAIAQPKLESEGHIAFQVDNHRFLCVGHGFIEFHFNGEPQRLTRELLPRVQHVVRPLI